MDVWKITERRGGVAVQWERVEDTPNRLTITREIRRSRSGGMGGIRFVIRGNVNRTYAALTLDDAKQYAGFWADVWRTN